MYVVVGISIRLMEVLLYLQISLSSIINSCFFNHKDLVIAGN